MYDDNRGLFCHFSYSLKYLQVIFRAASKLPLALCSGQQCSQMSANYSTQSVRGAAAYPPHQHLETPSKQSTNQQCVIPALPCNQGLPVH